jgi:hypothetical protein
LGHGPGAVQDPIGSSSFVWIQNIHLCTFSKKAIHPLDLMSTWELAPIVSTADWTRYSGEIHRPKNPPRNRQSSPKMSVNRLELYDERKAALVAILPLGISGIKAGHLGKVSNFSHPIIQIH